MLKYRFTLREILDELISRLSAPILESIEYLLPGPYQLDEL